MTDRSPSSCPEPMPLKPDPSVALVAYRYESVSEPGMLHDTAFLLTEAAGGECESLLAHHVPTDGPGGRMFCKWCRLLLAAWQCDCRGFVAHDHCWHVKDAKRRWSEQQRRPT